MHIVFNVLIRKGLVLSDCVINFISNIIYIASQIKRHAGLQQPRIITLHIYDII